MAIVEGRFQGRLETPLSPLGRRQAELAGIRLADPTGPPRIPVPAGPPVDIVHSPLGRAAETAAAAPGRAAAGSTASGRPGPSAGPGSRSRSPRATGRGSIATEVVGRYPAELEAWRLRPAEANAPGGESLIDAADRGSGLTPRGRDRRRSPRPCPARDPIGTSVGGYPAGHGSDAPWALLVGHDGIFKVALLALLGLPLDRFWAFPWGLTGISVVEIVAGRAVLRAHNLTDHLGPLQADRAAEPSTSAAEVRSEAEAASPRADRLALAGRLPGRSRSPGAAARAARGAGR